jgi:hypothetical protein
VLSIGLIVAGVTVPVLCQPYRKACNLVGAQLFVNMKDCPEGPLPSVFLLPDCECLGNVVGKERPKAAAKRASLQLISDTEPHRRRFSFPSVPPSEEGSPGEVRSRCPSAASLATGPAGLPQRG